MLADRQTSSFQVAVSRTKIVVPATLGNQTQDQTQEQGESYFAHSVPLTPLDLVVPKVNAALVLFFDDPHGVFADEQRLESSLAHTLAEFPTLAGHLVESGQTLPSLAFSNRGALFVFAAAKPVLLQEIHKAHYAPHSIPAELLPRGPFPAPGETVLAVQLTRFSDDNVALAFRRHHQVTDFPGFMDFVSRWSYIHDVICRGKVKDLVQNTLPASLHIHRTSRDLAQLVSSVPPASQYENGEYRVAASAHDSGMTRQPEPIYASLFALSKDALSSLKHAASGDCKHGSWVSTNDAVAALFWRAITRARGLEQRDDAQTKLGLAVNGREKIKPFNPDSSLYAGNCIIGVCISRSAQELVDEPLGRSAGHLRKALTLHTAHRIRSSVDFLLSLNAATQLPLLRTAHTEVFGDDVAVTQWSKYPLYDASTVGFGSGSAPFKVSPGPMVGDGVVVILPAAPSKTCSAGIEVMIGLTAEPMRKLRMDEELLRYATIIG
ncbi:hypothetical protein HDU86_008412 [Geranomyces michiganensis]|nr:hypothetical protein HDU86_008412 [Geranomyces michiganensis]